MNYRHAFHAGSFADVMKHVVLTRIVEYLKLKQAAFRVIDTHAGIGRYDLTSTAAQRSPEWKDGIGRVLGADLPARAAALIDPYLSAVRAENAAGALRYYPGSPLLVRRMLRAQDRLFAMELHPEDAATLKAIFAGDVQVRVIPLDGWLALGAQLPPKEKRGLVLVDPPFEEGEDYDRLVEGLVRGFRRFPTGTFALWYPLKEVGTVRRFVAALEATAIPRMLRVELEVAPAGGGRLFGTGMVVVNPPFVLEDELRVLLPALAKVLGREGAGRHRLTWIRGE
jgi:23S rRNA (adenine2030-N6)-methyltransferase